MSDVATTTADASGDTPPVTQIVPLPWWKILIVRALRSAIQSFLGLQAVMSVLGQGGFTDPQIVVGLKVAAGAALVSLLQNAAELLTGVDKSAPGFRG